MLSRQKYFDEKSDLLVKMTRDLYELIKGDDELVSIYASLIVKTVDYMYENAEVKEFYNYINSLN